MRNFFRSVLVIASLALIVTACKKDPEPVKPELTVDSKEASFNAEAGSKTIAVTAVGGEFTATVESGKDWAIITDKSATGFKINVTANTAYDQREANVTVALTGAESVVIKVTQIGLAPALVIDNAYRTLTFAYTAGDTIIPVVTNGEYEIAQGDAAWITISDKTLAGFKIAVAANAVSEPRVATLTATLEDLTPIEIVVTQDPKPSLSIAANSLHFVTSGGDTTIAVTVINGKYSAVVEEGKTWVTADTTASGLKITVAGNNTIEPRSANITLSLPGAENVVISITQNKAGILVEPYGDVLFNTSIAAEKILTVNTAAFTYSVVEGERDPSDTTSKWLSVERVGAELKIKVGPRLFYPDTDPSGRLVYVYFPERTATLTISLEGEDPVILKIKHGADLPKKTEPYEAGEFIMKEYYVGDDNRTLWGRAFTDLFNMVSYAHFPISPNRNDFFITKPNKIPVLDDKGNEVETPNEHSWTFPFYFTMDLGTEVYLNSIKITPRTNRNYRLWEYGVGAPYKFTLWGTNVAGLQESHPEGDAYWTETWKTSDWEHLGDFTCQYLGNTLNIQVDDYNEDGTPKVDANGNPVKKWTPVPIAEAGHEDASTITPDWLGPINSSITEEAMIKAGRGYDFGLLPTTKPVRYVRFQINEVWGRIIIPGTEEYAPISYVNISEVWFWGDPVPAAGN